MKKGEEKGHIYACLLDRVSEDMVGGYEGRFRHSATNGRCETLKKQRIFFTSFSRIPPSRAPDKADSATTELTAGLKPSRNRENHVFFMHSTLRERQTRPIPPQRN